MVQSDLSVVIMAGGKGTRLYSLGLPLPKPMVPIMGVPILERQIEVLANQGMTKIHLVIGGEHAEKISSYFGDGSNISPVTGQSFGVQISYFIEEKPLGTAGALSALKVELNPQVLVVNGDLVFDVDMTALYHAHMQFCEGKGATILVQPTDHPFDSGLISIDSEKRVVDWSHPESRAERYHNLANSGIHILSRDLIADVALDRTFARVDLDRDLLAPLMRQHLLHAYLSCEYVRDAGTPERLEQIQYDIKKNLPENLSSRKPRKAIFLDRDGTINRYVGYCLNSDDLILIEGAAQAIRQMHQKGYLVIAVTNQAAVERGWLTHESLDIIHQKLETLLGNEGAYLNAIYYCPHRPSEEQIHPLEEFEQPAHLELQQMINCTCRKPQPGLLLQAADDFNIDLSQSWMVGDSESDIAAGRAAGCRVASVGDLQTESGLSYASILEFAEVVLV